MFRPLSLFFFALCVLLVPATAVADESAEHFVRSRQTELRDLLKKAPGEARDERISKIFDAMLDYERLAKDSLQDWDKRTEQERREFSDVLKALVQRSYRGNMDRTVSYDVAYRGEAEGEEAMVVRTVASKGKDSREQPVSIDYVVHKVGGKWRVRDIVTEGASLVRNYRRQFGRIVRKDGFGELMRKMRRKLES